MLGSSGHWSSSAVGVGNGVGELVDCVGSLVGDGVTATLGEGVGLVGEAVDGELLGGWDVGAWDVGAEDDGDKGGDVGAVVPLV